MTDFGEGVKSDIKLFAFILQSCVKQMDDVHAYLLGEDIHVYGVWLDMGENAFKIVFFPPDFPQFVHMMRAKDIQKILSWLQTVPLEYVHIYYAYLKRYACLGMMIRRHGVSIPFPCPPLPERDDC